MAGLTDSRSDVVLVVVVILTALSTVFVALRMVSRCAIVRKVTLDDWFMILAWVLGVGLSISICYGTSVGLGKHEVTISVDDRSLLKKSEYAFSVFYNPVLMATKTSILIFFLRLSKAQKIFKWAVLLTIVVVNVAGLALTLLNVLQCIPVDAAFDTPIPDSAQCKNIVTLYLCSAPVNIITDLAILFLPMPILTAMRLPTKQKIILVITFGFGWLVVAVDVVRIAYLQDAFTSRISDVQNHVDSGNADSRNNTDFSWYASYSYMWTAIEVHVGMMCACVPALKPLVSRFMPHALRNKGDSNYGTGTSPFRHAASDEVPSPRADAVDFQTNALTGPTVETARGREDSIGIMDFLTTPDMSEMPPAARTSTYATTAASGPAFFDFVNVKQKKSMVYMTNKESFFSVAMVTVLFFLWGFAYGLLDVLNSHFQVIARMSAGQTIGIHSAYFGAYLIGPLTFGRLVLKHWGFKACYIVGLVIYACGTLIFWPSAVLTSFPAFLVSNFIVGLGLSTLELAANGFIALCGPQRYAETRLNLSQAVQAIGTVCSPLLAQKVLFGPVQDAPTLIDVQWTYLGIAFFTVLLSVLYFYVPLPEATDAELEDVTEQRSNGSNHAQIGPCKVIFITLAFGAFSQWCYVGGQEAVSTSFPEYLHLVDPTFNPTDFQAIGHTAFAVSRFIAAAACVWITPRYVLLVSYTGLIVFSTLAMNWRGTTPSVMIIMVYFFEGPIFSLIYAMCLRGMGRHTKTASTILTAAISGGAVFPPIMHAVLVQHNVEFSYCVVVASFAFGATLAIYFMLVPQAKRQVDPGKQDECKGPGLLPSTGVDNKRRESRVSFAEKAGRRLSWRPGVKGRNRRKSGNMTEHIEKRQGSDDLT
ncbi:MFS general substrate transporter [Aulographum hederae CBS 113979]|uniref:MFS general substrate transporter n=1 Tax=Aulographum hederae CBS 113979 TaxID=1176131 RepID=A0A6G1H4K9_9PEZI|nr:MFS general substrate transporter [Aulographum hederae CBS 113979]